MKGSFKLFGKNWEWNSTIMGAVVMFLVMCIPFISVPFVTGCTKVREWIQNLLKKKS